jgi:hypothetical protein
MDSRTRKTVKHLGFLGGVLCCPSLTTWWLAVTLASSLCSFAETAEYSFVPDKMDGTKADSVVTCNTPPGWKGWKDDPSYWKGLSGFNQELLRSGHRESVSFVRVNCESTSKCITLVLETRGRDSRGQPDVRAGMSNFLRQVRQHQDMHSDPSPSVSRLDSFSTGEFGTLTIWQIRCSFWNDYLLTMITRRDILVTIYLEAPDIQQCLADVDSLKQLARSVRMTSR